MLTKKLLERAILDIECFETTTTLCHENDLTHKRANNYDDIVLTLDIVTNIELISIRIWPGKNRVNFLSGYKQLRNA